jgi:putative serine protease PepD
VGADEGFDDDGPEFRDPLPPEDRVWRHPAELGALAAAAPDTPSAGRSPWAVGFVSVIGGVLLAGSLMFGAGGVGDEPGRIALRPIATLSPRVEDGTTRVAALDSPAAPRSLVGVDVHTADDVRMGNGLVVEAQGYVVTTASLVAGADDIRVTDPDGGSHVATLLGTDEVNDLAVLQVSDLTWAPEAVDRNALAGTGQSAYVITASRGVATGSRTTTIRSVDARLSSGTCDLHGVLQLEDTLDISAAGAPVLDDTGRIIGIATTRDTDDPTVAIPARTIQWVARQIVAGGQINHGWLGVEGVTAPSDPTTESEPVASGALVNRVVDASPAAVAGLAAEDVVVALDGEPVTTMGSLVVAVRERAPGTTVTVSVVRDGTVQEVPVALATAPAPTPAVDTLTAAPGE